MRVITGSARGSRLVCPREGVRPTADRVREALFSHLGVFRGNERVLDLFAGTGALGIEALSRGAAECVFVEEAKPSLDAIRRNLEHCRLADRGVVVADNVFRWLRRIDGGSRFDMVFADPPYGEKHVEELARRAGWANLLNPGAVVILEHESQSPSPPALSNGYILDFDRRYGGARISIYREAG
ncbi:MAG: Ribosomal RNA small subunit methyltransferase D [Myxococcota bacterium]|nr:Ribosomal RNA small subunit methyltransferase D [Myxococcota bacterium]